MKSLILITTVVAAIAIGFWLANTETEMLPAKVKPTASAPLLSKNGQSLPTPNLEPPHLPNPKTELEDKNAKIKAILEKRKLNKTKLPWEKSEVTAEKFDRHMWETRRGDYLKLLNGWGITSDQAKEVEQILLDRELSRKKLGRQSDDAGVMTPESKRISSAIRELKEQANAKITAIVGEEKSNELQRFEDSALERKTVDKLASTIETTGALTQDQERAVMDALYNVRKSFAEKRGIDSPGTLLGPTYRERVLSELQNSLDGNQLLALKDILQRDAAFFERPKK